MFAAEAPLSIFKSDALINALWISGIVVAAYLVVMWIALTLWVYHDIRSRTVDPAVRVLLTGIVAVFNIPGLLLYLALRPQEALVESYNRQLETDAFMREIGREEACPQCQRAVSDSFVSCPYCRAALQTACYGCDRSLKSFWAICPYCGAERMDDAAAARTPAARQADPAPMPMPAASGTIFAPGRVPDRAPAAAPATH